MERNFTWQDLHLIAAVLATPKLDTEPMTPADLETFLRFLVGLYPQHEIDLAADSASWGEALANVSYDKASQALYRWHAQGRAEIPPTPARLFDIVRWIEEEQRPLPPARPKHTTDVPQSWIPPWELQRYAPVRDNPHERLPYREAGWEDEDVEQ